MIIAVNTRLLIKNRLDGIGWFTFETLKRITVQHPEHKFVFLFDRPYHKDFIFSDNIEPIVLFPPARHPVLWFIFFEWSVYKALKKYKADIFLSTDGWVSLRSDIKTINVIHDINFEHFPKFLKLSHRIYMKFFFRRFAKKSDKILTVSKFSKTDITSLYNLENGKVDVIYNGANSNYKPIGDLEKIEIKKQYSIENDFFIFISSIHPRKNIENILISFDKFKNETNSKTKFIIVGDKQWWNNSIKKTYKSIKFKNDIIFTGILPPEILNKLLSSSKALIYTSLYEGFGIPIVEAFNAETAVITSNITSMPEIAGDAALLINPYSIDDICNALKKIDINNDLRIELIEKGKQRKNLFNWDKTALGLWKTIEELLKTV